MPGRGDVAASRPQSNADANTDASIEANDDQDADAPIERIATCLADSNAIGLLTDEPGTHRAHDISRPLFACGRLAAPHLSRCFAPASPAKANKFQRCAIIIV